MCPSTSLWRRTLQDRVSQHNIRPARPRPWPRPRPRLQYARPRPVFWSQTGLVLRPTVSDHITEWNFNEWNFSWYRPLSAHHVLELLLASKYMYHILPRSVGTKRVRGRAHASARTMKRSTGRWCDNAHCDSDTAMRKNITAYKTLQQFLSSAKNLGQK